MPDHARRLRLRTGAALAAAAFASVLLSPAAAGAQTSQRERDAKLNEMRMRQLALRDLERLKNPPPPKAPAGRPAYRDVEEDFEQLQRVNYSLAGAAAPGAPLDYASIRKQAAEVRKRAVRLRGYLSLPKVAGEPDKEEEIRTAEGLRAALASLDALVNSFAWNPAFRRPDIVDLEQSSKASRDLARIIDLSERIRKRAEEFSKPAAGADKK